MIKAKLSYGFPVNTDYFKANAHDSIYDKMMVATDGDHEISCDAASWCELAVVGEKYEFREGIIEIVND